MANTRGTILQVVAYTLYGLVVYLVVVYFTFPYDLLRQRLVERLSPGPMRLVITTLHPDLPPGLLLQHVRLETNHAAPGEPVVHLHTVRLQPAWLSLFSGELQVRIAAALYDGRLQGDLFPPVAAAAVWKFQGHLADIHLEQYPWVWTEGEAWLHGRLGGHVQVTVGREGGVQEGVLKPLLQPLVLVGGPGSRLPLPQDVTCDTVQGELKMTPRQLQIVSLTCEGNDLSIEVSGSVKLQQPLHTSTLDLNLKIRSETVYKQELGLLGTLVRQRPDRRGVLSFIIEGTVGKPTFKPQR
ncbi:hypothetical protein NKDENANG_00519 [Candidatus Entotheonellaceae bacterium PAL068K]